MSDLRFRFVAGRRRAAGRWRLLLAGIALALLLPTAASAGPCGPPKTWTFDNYPVFNTNCWIRGRAMPIYTTDGFDSYSTSEIGSAPKSKDLVVTNSEFGYQCMELVFRYLCFRWGVAYPLQYAAQACDGPLPDGLERFRPYERDPVPGDIMVYGRGACGVADPEFGHIAVVNGRIPGTRHWIEIKQQNTLYANHATQNVQVKCACAFLHVKTNRNGTGPRWSDRPCAEVAGRAPVSSGGRAPAPEKKGCHAESTSPETMWPVPCLKKN